MLGAEATQYEALLFTQKTSLQHVDMPRFGGKFVKACVDDVSEEGRGTGGEGVACDCDWRRTRTTSSGVTRREVRMLPVVADSIFWVIDGSTSMLTLSLAGIRP